MARRVYFAFHYQRDIWRVNQIRWSDFLKKEDEGVLFYDHSLWEKSKKEGDLAIKRMINAGLNNTSVTVVLIGKDTWSRRWVRYEMIKSYERGNGFLGIHIHQQENQNKQTDSRGQNPFLHLGFIISDNGKRTTFYERDNGDWRVFDDLPEIPSNYAKEHWGKSFNLNFYDVYDWKDDNGYKNLASWIEAAAPK